jgi:hypothetical protein
MKTSLTGQKKWDKHVDITEEEWNKINKNTFLILQKIQNYRGCNTALILIF